MTVKLTDNEIREAIEEWLKAKHLDSNGSIVFHYNAVNGTITADVPILTPADVPSEGPYR